VSEEKVQFVVIQFSDQVEFFKILGWENVVTTDSWVKILKVVDGSNISSLIPNHRIKLIDYSEWPKSKYDEWHESLRTYLPEGEPKQAGGLN